MTVFHPPGSKKYYYKFLLRGVWYRGSTETSSKRQAQAVERAQRQEALKNLLLAPPAPSGNDTTVLDAVSKYLDMQRLEHNADLKRIAHEEKHFHKLVTWIGPHVRMTEVDLAMMRHCVTMRRKEFARTGNGRERLKKNLSTGAVEGKPLSGKTINLTTWQLFRRVYILARDEWGVVVKPIQWNKIKQHEAGPRRREVKFDEEALFEAELKEGYLACFRFAIKSGMRLSSFSSLRWTQIDFGNREICFIQKGDRIHTVKIDDEMLDILLQERGNHSEYVFTYVARRTNFNKTAGKQFVRGERYPITYSGFSESYKRVNERLGLDLRVHDLRRTAGGRLVRATGNLKAASTLLGHSDIMITAKHYAHILEGEMVELQNRRNSWEIEKRGELDRLLAKKPGGDGGARSVQENVPFMRRRLAKSLK